MLLALSLAFLLISPPQNGSLMADSPPLTDMATSKGFLNAQQLKRLCSAPETSPSHEFDVCLGYIAGSIDQMVARDMISPRVGRRYCPITTISLGELREAFMSYMEAHPELAKAAAAPILERAAAPVLSCKPLRLPADM